LQTNLPRLRLAVVTVSIADGDSGATVPDLVDAIHAHLAPAGASAVEAFNDRLLAVGYASLDDYQDLRFSTEALDWFDVTTSFPRIRPEDLMAGVGKVSYTVLLTACEPFRIAHPFQDEA
jgi:hypothetical protein